jgi:predicted CoA-substrate-specific enzyme activase
MDPLNLSIGIDVGSVAVKIVVLRDGAVIEKAYCRFAEGPFETLRDLLAGQFARLAGQSFCLGLTGIGGKTAQGILGGRVCGEVASLAAANFHLLPDARTVIEMGGEDSKLLILDSVNRTVIDFAMNAQCAAGTGSFLDQQASRMNLSIEQEFGELALKSEHPPRIAGRCSVFAKSDMIHLQQIATPDYDIVAGLCFAVARNFKSAIARGKRFDRPIAFEGGVAANPGMVRAFTEILELADGELAVPEHSNVMGALGAALLATESKSVVQSFDPSRIDAYLQYREAAESGREALTFDFPNSKYYDITSSALPQDYDTIDVFLGVDVGSLSTNVVLIDRDQRVIARRYLMTEGRPIEAVRRGLAEIGLEVGNRVRVVAAGTTGSGRYLTADYIGADIVRNEITAQATAAVHIDPTVDTIFEIGGQDSKYISLENRAVIDFEMNKACAAGTGSFLQEQAEKLNINIEREFGDRALAASCPVGCGERCTVFMESDLVAHQRSGAKKEDLIAGLAYSIASNYLTKVVGDRRIGTNVFFQGGVAWNRGVVAAFEKLIGQKVTVPPHHDVTGAIGAAILAMEKVQQAGFVTAFKGFDLYKRKYNLSSFPCHDCSNQCEIHKVEVEGDQTLYYGARCEKYEVESRSERTLPPDYFGYRQKSLFRTYGERSKARKIRGRIGIPRVLHFFDYYPFWRAFFESLDFQVILSEVTSQRTVEQALELFSAETCYPIKLVYGHVASLQSKQLNYIFLPSLIKVAGEINTGGQEAFVCPYVQNIGSSIAARFDFAATGTELITTPVNFSEDPEALRRGLREMAGQFGLSDRQLKRGIRSGLDAHRQFRKIQREEGIRALENLAPSEKAIVVISRPYNGFDHRLSLEIPEKIRQLGLKVIPLDFLPMEETSGDLGNMYWRYGRRILQAAHYIRRHPNLFAVYLTSFGCGPDSFILHFFRKAMAGKPHLQLEIDEHSADAGLITRCEAFVDSLRFYEFMPPVADFTVATDAFRPFERKIYIPNMCDHAYAMQAAFERHGLNAEVMPEPDEQTLECGKKFTSGKECFPCIVTTGDMVKKLKSPEFNRARGVFFMPGADGPCRFGLYSQFHRLVLDDLGYRDVPIYSPNSKDGYAQFGLEGTSFRSLAWRAMVFVDCLQKALHRSRPYDLVAGESDRVYRDFLNRLHDVVVNDDSLTELAVAAGKGFASIVRRNDRRPIVGVVGEIYLRNNRFSNNHLINKLEQLGLEVRLATFTEWPLYTSWTYRRDSWKARRFRDWLKAHLQIHVQHWKERQIFEAFHTQFPIPHDELVDSVLSRATAYMSLEVKGEAVLSVGKAIEMVNSGAAGVVKAMPFNCMPGTVVSSLSRKVSEDLGQVPWLNISYEGLQDTAEDTRLEAFADQVKSFDCRAARRRVESPAYERR